MIKFPFPTMALAALALAACSGAESEERTETRVDGGTIRTEGSGENTTAIIETDDGAGAVIGAGAAAEADSGPIFARPYPGSRVVSSVTSPSDDAGLITFQTDAPVDTVIAYYRERADEAGFNSLAEMTMGGSRHFGAEAPSGGEFNVVVQPQDGQSTVTVTWEGVPG